MNTALRPVVIFLILLVTALPVIAATRGAVSIASIEGHVDYIPAAPGRTVTAKPNTSLKEGDAVEVPGPGNAEMVTRDGSIVRISGGSRLKVLSIENNAVQLFLESGRAYVKYPGLKGHPLFLNSPSAELDAFDPAIFRADITPSGDTEVSVYSGQLYIAQPKGRMTIIAGTRLVMKKDGGDPVYTTNRPADAWDEWNRKKDGPQPAEKGRLRISSRLPETMHCLPRHTRRRPQFPAAVISMLFPHPTGVIRTIIIRGDTALIRGGGMVRITRDGGPVHGTDAITDTAGARMVPVPIRTTGPLMVPPPIGPTSAK